MKNLTLRQKISLQKSIALLTKARQSISEAHLIMMQAKYDRPRISSIEIGERILELENLLTT